MKLKHETNQVASHVIISLNKKFDCKESHNINLYITKRFKTNKKAL